GSGKTEVAINYSRRIRREDDRPVSLIDLDLVNPYFRSREAIDILRSEGISVIAPKGEQFYSDLPIILPEVRRLLAASEESVVLDVGGDEVGASILASLRDAVPDRRFGLWVVLNARRPFTQTVQGSLRMIRDLERACGLRVTGLVSNTHLLHETTVDVVLNGLEVARRTAAESGLRLKFVAARESLFDQLKTAVGETPLLTMRLTMHRPWEKN
ncbi:MAG TPA: hypothetical protein VI895_07070, partial [Bdellovibrionota bacterium]|nr:hypothetical protein [Bdellovibrionota bacterium]